MNEHSMESISANIFVADIKATIAFYERLGFIIIATAPEGDDPVFVMMTCGTATIMFQTFASIENTLPTVSRAGGGSLLFYIKIKNIRTFYDKIKDDVPLLHGLEKTFYGSTEFSIRDNNNFMVTFAEDE